MECEYPEPISHRQRIIPTGLPELSFYLGSRATCLDDGHNFNAYIIFSGHQKDHYDISVSGHLKMISVTFQPNGLSALNKLNPGDLLNQSIDASLVFGSDIKLLSEQLYEAPTTMRQLELIESFLISNLTAKINSYKSERISHLIHQLNPIGQTISSMAEQTYWSRKQFERTFSALVGCTPKTFLNTIRFQYALHQKAQNPNLSLIDLSLSCGYYDQAHMNHEFINFSGLSPRQFFKSCLPQSDYYGINY